jgi:hypothetical protein
VVGGGGSVACRTRTVLQLADMIINISLYLHVAKDAYNIAVVPFSSALKTKVLLKLNVDYDDYESRLRQQNWTMFLDGAEDLYAYVSFMGFRKISTDFLN